MSRALGMFPYSADDVIAPHTDGTMEPVPTGRMVEIDVPNTDTYIPGKNRGAIVKGTIGNTDYIYANVVAHGVFAGDS